MTNEEIVEQIQSGINVSENLGILYEQNKGFIYSIVKPFMKYADPDDLLQEAYLGLHDAVFAFQFDDSKFITYLPYRIRKHCIQFIESFSNTKRIPHSRLNEIRKYQKFCQEYSDAHGTAPDDKTIMMELELTEKRLDNIRKTIYEQNCTSIHKPVAGTEDAALEDILASDEDLASNVEDKMMQEEIKKVVNEAVQELPSKESEVIQSRYLEDASQVQIASKMNISSQRVSQIEKKALERLKNMEQLQMLHDEIYGYDSKMAYSMPRRYAIDNHTSPTEMLALKRVEYEERIMKQQDKLDNLFDTLLKG